jgi:hypothetical protein
MNHFTDRHINLETTKVRNLPGIDFNTPVQLEILSKLNFAKEFCEFIKQQSNLPETEAFSITNGNFESGDAEYLFQFIRLKRPKLVIEIGCGASTKIIAGALSMNKASGQSNVDHICIEPYLQPFLDNFENIELIRSKVEDTDLELFDSLGPGDLLFIDSSHIIRPGGDLLCEYLQIIPLLNSGVFCHVHDVFSPRDYPVEWISQKVLFWNEQYLLEALLSNSSRFRIVAALNFLKHDHYDALKLVAPFLSPSREPGSFYFEIV